MMAMTPLLLIALSLAAEPSNELPPPPPPAVEAAPIEPAPAMVSQREPEPSTGLGQRIVGGIMLGVGLANLAASAVCYTDF
jgi:hypothetical protein